MNEKEDLKKLIYQTLFLLMSLAIMVFLFVKGVQDLFIVLGGDDHFIRGILYMLAGIAYGDITSKISDYWN